MLDNFYEIIAAKAALASKVAGAIAGAAFSILMIPPKPNSKGNRYRAFIGVVAGIIFTPATQKAIPFLNGTLPQDIMAAACLTGFASYSILEIIARLLSKEDTFLRFLEEMTELRGNSKKEKD